MVKVAPKSIEAFLKKPDATCRVVLLYGPDSGLVRERAKQLIAAWLGADYDPFALVDLNESALLADHALLADELNAIHMMAPKRVILVRDAGDKLTRILAGCVAYFNASVTVILCADELASRSSLRQWAEKESCAAALACYHDEIRNIADVVRASFEAHQIVADRDAIDYLCQQLGNDRYVTRQELEKCCLYSAESKRFSLADAERLVDYNREASFDDMVHALADRNVKSLDSALHQLLREHHSPVAYLRMAQRYFNRLYHIRGQMAAGMSAEAVVQGLRPPVYFKHVPLLIRHAEAWSPPQIARALGLLVNAELACKSSDVPPEAASGRRLLQLTQIRG